MSLKWTWRQFHHTATLQECKTWSPIDIYSHIATFITGSYCRKTPQHHIMLMLVVKCWPICSIMFKTWHHPQSQNYVKYCIALSEEDWATDTGNMHRKFGEIWTRGFWDMWAERHTDAMITILCSHTGSEVKIIMTWLYCLITGPPTRSVGGQTSDVFWRLSSYVVYHLSLSVTLHGGPAGSFTHASQAMTTCHLQSNYSSTAARRASSVTSR